MVIKTDGRSISGHISDEEYVENVSIRNYIIIKELGTGSTAKVVLAFDKNSGRRAAIKIVKRKQKEESPAPEGQGFELKTQNPTDIANEGFNDERIYREVVISVLLDHPHIIKLLDFLYSDSYFFLVFEYVKGNQLYDIILKETRISEERARKYFRQVLSAIDYIHRNSIVHRDLKIENIIIDHNDNVKLLDFGLSNFYDNKNFLKTFCGSLYFAAPELLLGHTYNGPEVDIWSLGVILYVMLCGKVPFDDESVRELQNKIKVASFEYTVSLSKHAQELISNMIVPDVAKRFTLPEIIGSKWINTGYSSKVESYVGKRFPLAKLNNEYVKALHSALSFQFSNTSEHLESFFNICKQQTESLDTVYWTKNPIISMYYLLSENIGAYSNVNTRLLRFDNRSSSITDTLHKFVMFVFSNSSSQRPSKYFFAGAFQDSSQESSSATQKLNITFQVSIKAT
ncbi:CAMK/CAMKL/KIN1 protein kinase [Vittaforma corneae ATCC 50505]|uniref:CAMK/CAMKL/KIN1 protein kinase n=1 Tax=Vittaforma corneae (strain ATCC 50505) TaxID=993615 RepID=L2GLB9_VITCO|nr:CAMK/CAMKL/KIN1 protein kinase [Vittaforma corneae ATCC 50505]ELA41673.1 CAMK/CAMKL/KIN1 protein kinase [Vittaforma corneae ATCC 50505]